MAALDQLGERVAALEATLKAHSEEDARRFDELNDKTDEVRSDVKTLLQRTVQLRRKTPWAALATIVAAVVTAVGGWFGVHLVTK